MSGTYFVERPACPACRSKQSRTIYVCSYLDNPIRDYLVSYYKGSGRLDLKYLDGAVYQLEECSDCGLVFQRFVPNEELSETLYCERPIQAAITERGHVLAYYQYLVCHVMNIAAFFGRRTHLIRVFDFGFGWGEWAFLAQGFGLDVYGCELPEDKKSHARTHGVNVLEWEEIPGKEFDFIHAIWIFEHLTQPYETLEQLVRGLRRGGLILISVPYREHIQRRLRINNWMAPKGSRDSLNSVHPMEHLNCWEGASLDRMAARFGLKPFKIPLRKQQIVLNLGSPRELVKSILRPLRRNWIPNQPERCFRLA